MYNFNKNNYVSKKVCQVGLWKKKNKNQKLLQKEVCPLTGSSKAQDLVPLVTQDNENIVINVLNFNKLRQINKYMYR